MHDKKLPISVYVTRCVDLESRSPHFHFHFNRFGDAAVLPLSQAHLFGQTEPTVGKLQNLVPKKLSEMNFI